MPSTQLFMLELKAGSPQHRRMVAKLFNFVFLLILVLELTFFYKYLDRHVESRGSLVVTPKTPQRRTQSFQGISPLLRGRSSTLASSILGDNSRNMLGKSYHMIDLCFS